ncbi:MAG TPA: hypothetical protein VES92_11895 [Nitrospiraceae bacterium]|nr:hypothetical protein [Nitrospiraceae bacterium]
MLIFDAEDFFWATNVIALRASSTFPSFAPQRTAMSGKFLAD